MAQGRSTKISSMIKRIRTSQLSIKNYLSVNLKVEPCTQVYQRVGTAPLVTTLEVNPEPSTLNPQPYTLNPQPSTLKPEP
jgi:hypothetical protein